jgi:hypothetical protein
MAVADSDIKLCLLGPTPGTPGTPLLSSLNAEMAAEGQRTI